MKNLLLAIVLMMSIGNAGQPAVHTISAMLTIDFVEQWLDSNGLSWLSPVALPLTGLATHVFIDHAVSEGYQGAYQYDVGLSLLAVGYLAQKDDAARERMFRAALWGAIVPDSILKK